MRPVRQLFQKQLRRPGTPLTYQVLCQKTEGGARIMVKKIDPEGDNVTFNLYWNLKERRYLDDGDRSKFKLYNDSVYAAMDTPEMHEKIVQLLWAD